MKIIIKIWYLAVLLTAFSCGTDDFLPGRAKGYTLDPAYPDSAVKETLPVATGGTGAGFTLVTDSGSVTALGGGAYAVDGPVFFETPSNVTAVRDAELVVGPDGSVSGKSMLPRFNTGVWKELVWQKVSSLVPVTLVKGSQLLDPASEYCLQGGATNRLPVVAERVYMLFKLDLSLNALAAVIPGTPVSLNMDRVPIPQFQLYYLFDPCDPSFFLTLNTANFEKLEKWTTPASTGGTTANSSGVTTAAAGNASGVTKEKAKSKLKGIGKLDSLNGFGIGLSSRGLLPFRMDYTNMLEPELGVRYSFGTHLWLKAAIGLTVYGLPFTLDGNAAINLNPSGAGAVNIGVAGLKFRMGLNGKLLFDFASYIAKGTKPGASPSAGVQTLQVLSSILQMSELAGASVVCEISDKPTLYFSTYAGTTNITVDFSQLGKINAFENGTEKLQQALNAMLQPPADLKLRFGGYLQWDTVLKDFSWYLAFQGKFGVRLKQVLGPLASIADSTLQLQGNDAAMEAELAVSLGNRTGFRMNGKLLGGFSLMKGISLQSGVKLDMTVRSVRDFSFQASGKFGLQLFKVGADLSGDIAVSPKKVALAGQMNIRLGSLGGLYGRISGSYYPATESWNLYGSGSFKLLGYTIADASIRAVNGGLWVTGKLTVPNLSTISVRGMINFRTGEVALTGAADITIKGYKLAGATITLGNRGLEFSGSLSIPNLSAVTISGKVTADGQFSVASRASIKLLGYSIADAMLEFDNSGLKIDGYLSIPNVSSLHVTGSVSSSGSVSISGKADITIGRQRLAAAEFRLSKSLGFLVSAHVDLFGFMSLDVAGGVSPQGRIYISGAWSADSGQIDIWPGWVRGEASITARLGSSGFSLTGSVKVSYSLRIYSDSFTLSAGIIADSRGVGFEYKFPIIGKKTIWIRKNKGIHRDGFVLPQPDNVRVFAVQPAM